MQLNGKLVAETSTAGARWSLGEVLAHASRGEQLQAGELFGTGTLPGGSGIENGRLLAPGDVIELGIDGVGTLTNRIVAGGQSMKVIDLSKPIRFNRGDPRFMQVRGQAQAPLHRKAAGVAARPAARLFPKDFVGWADDTITKMGVHSTTHIDAPWHYGPTSGGAPAATIDEMPLEKCIGPGVVLDMTHKADNDPITVADLEAALAKTGAKLDKRTIVLIRTGRDRLMGTKAFWTTGTGMSAEATEWLIDQGPTVMGIDQWGWDLPFHAQIAKAKATDDDTLFWEAHRVGQRRPYWHMEQLTNLGALPPHGFEVMVFPLKIVGASAAPARVVAVIR